MWMWCFVGILQLSQIAHAMSCIAVNELQCNALQWHTCFHRQLPSGAGLVYMHYYNTKVPLFSDYQPWLSLRWSHISKCTSENSLSYLVWWKLTIFPSILNRQPIGYSFILQSYRAVYELEIDTEIVRMPSGQNSHFCEVLMGLWKLWNDPRRRHMFTYDSYTINICMDIVINVDIVTVSMPLIYIFLLNAICNISQTCLGPLSLEMAPLFS